MAVVNLLKTGNSQQHYNNVERKQSNISIDPIYKLYNGYDRMVKCNEHVDITSPRGCVETPSPSISGGCSVAPLVRTITTTQHYSTPNTTPSSTGSA